MEKALVILEKAFVFAPGYWASIGGGFILILALRSPAIIKSIGTFINDYRKQSSKNEARQKQVDAAIRKAMNKKTKGAGRGRK